MYTYKNVYEYKILLDASSWFSDSQYCYYKEVRSQSGVFSSINNLFSRGCYFLPGYLQHLFFFVLGIQKCFKYVSRCGSFKIDLSEICEPIQSIYTLVSFQLGNVFFKKSFYNFFFYCSGVFVNSAIILQLDSHSLSQYLFLFSTILPSSVIISNSMFFSYTFWQTCQD